MIKKTLQKPEIQKLLKFSLTGVSGIIVNMGIFYILTHIFLMNYKYASPVAIELSILSNFFINNYWTWRDAVSTPLMNRLIKYHATAAVSGVINYLLLILLTEQFHLHMIISNFIGIAVGSIINFLLNNFWTFK